MKVGRYEVSLHDHGSFRLDGGAMFGVVPRTIWSRLIPPDELNRIPMATRSVVIQDGDRKMLVDLGCGDKWSAKTREIFAMPDTPYVPVESVTDVLVTHCHFDHVGGISRYKTGTQEIEPCYPSATHFISHENFQNARHPNVREKASYLTENLDSFKLVKTIYTISEQEIWPGITVHQCDGHTRGLQWVKITDGGVTVAYPTDVCPTASHLPLPYVLGYDMCAETSLADRQDFFAKASAGNWIVVFEHDPEVAAARIALDDRGRATVAERVEV